MHPSASWCAAGIRWIAQCLLDVAGGAGAPPPVPWPLGTRPAPTAADDLLLESRQRASRVI